MLVIVLRILAVTRMYNALAFSYCLGILELILQVSIPVGCVPPAFLIPGVVSLPRPPWTETPWTETPLAQRPPWTEIHWTETPLKEHGTRDRDPLPHEGTWNRQPDRK